MITEERIAQLRGRALALPEEDRPCDQGLAEFAVWDRRPETLPLFAARFVLSQFTDDLTDAEFEICVRRSPRMAMKQSLDRLTPELLDFCARKEPRWALEFCADRLTLELLDYCARQAPWWALRYCPDRLTPELREFCVSAVALEERGKA